MTEPRPPGDGRIGCGVLTHNRRDVLLGTLAAIAAQRRRPDAVVVVDGASTDGSGEAAAAFDALPVEVVRLDENVGAAAGRGEAMTRIADRGFDLCWLVDDDCRPAPVALERMLVARAAVSRCGMVGVRGGYRRFGLIRRIDHGVGPWPVPVDDVRAGLVEFVHLDSTLVDCRAIRQCGTPRADYFMGQEDVEYPLRLGDAGWRILLLDEPIIDLGHLGSAAPWRLYYQTRNELLMARDRGSPLGAAAWALRTAAFVAGHLRSPGDPWEKIRFRLRGAWDGARDVRGRTVGPAARPGVDR